MLDYYNSYCEFTTKDIAELVSAPLSVLYYGSLAAFIYRELTNPHLPKLITSSLKQKWMANKSLSMLQFPFIQIKLKSVSNEVQHSTNDLAYCINAGKNLLN